MAFNLLPFRRGVLTRASLFVVRQSRPHQEEEQGRSGEGSSDQEPHVDLRQRSHREPRFRLSDQGDAQHQEVDVR